MHQNLCALTHIRCDRYDTCDNCKGTTASYVATVLFSISTDSHLFILQLKTSVTSRKCFCHGPTGYSSLNTRLTLSASPCEINTYTQSHTRASQQASANVHQTLWTWAWAVRNGFWLEKESVTLRKRKWWCTTQQCFFLCHTHTQLRFVRHF